MSEAMLEEVKAATLVSDEREARGAGANGDQREGDEEPASEKQKALEEKEEGSRIKT